MRLDELRTMDFESILYFSGIEVIAEELLRNKGCENRSILSSVTSGDLVFDLRQK